MATQMGAVSRAEGVFERRLSFRHLLPRHPTPNPSQSGTRILLRVSLLQFQPARDHRNLVETIGLSDPERDHAQTWQLLTATKQTPLPIFAASINVIISNSLLG